MQKRHEPKTRQQKLTLNKYFTDFLVPAFYSRNPREKEKENEKEKVMYTTVYDSISKMTLISMFTSPLDVQSLLFFFLSFFSDAFFNCTESVRQLGLVLGDI